MDGWINVFISTVMEVLEMLKKKKLLAGTWYLLFPLYFNLLLVFSYAYSQMCTDAYFPRSAAFKRVAKKWWHKWSTFYFVAVSEKGADEKSCASLNKGKWSVVLWILCVVVTTLGLLLRGCK